ncbi:MAG: PilX N-terminal domain-containing pilus assembly protein [Bacteroidota bacterium]
MNRIVTSRSRRDGEAGNALVIALLVLFLLTSLGVSYIAVTKGDKQVAGNQLTSSQAFSNAEAGISEALIRMSYPNVNSSTYPGWPTESIGNYHSGWGRYIVTDPGNSGLDPQYNATLTDGLDNDLDAAVDESSEHYPEIGSKQNDPSLGLGLANRLDYPWVKIRYKLNGANQILLFGDDDNNPLTPPKENLVRGVPEIIITSAGRRGTGQKIVTVEAVKWPLPPTPGSVYTEGPMTFNGAAFYVDGHDHNYTAPFDTIAGAASLPGISTTNTATSITNNLNGQQSDNVLGSGASPSVATSPVNLDLQAEAAAWDAMADITLNGTQTNPSTVGWGTVSPMNPKIVHIASGDLHESGIASGCGVLVVDGDFVLSGSFSWYGVVIVLGNVQVTGGGATKQIIGALMVQGGIGSALNGNIKCLYSSAMISQLSSLTRYEVSSWIDQ